MLIQAVLLCGFGYAGLEKTAQPTSVFAAAGSGVAHTSIDNIWINPASSGFLPAFTASLFYYPSPYQLSQLTQYGLILALPIGIGTVSIGLQSVGFRLYRETAGSVNFSRPITNELSAGVTLHSYHISINGYGSTTVLSSDIGGIVTVNESLSLGISLGNVNGADIGGGEEIPRMITVGAIFRPLEQVQWTFDIVKEMRFPHTYKTGIQFSPIVPLKLFAGIQGEPSRLFGGIGVTVSPIDVQYGIGTHDDLGATHSIGVTFAP